MDGKKKKNTHSIDHCFFSSLDLLRRLNTLEESINDRHRQLHGASEQRREFDRIMSKLTEWIKTIEQQIKDPFANDLQQTASGIKDKYRSIQVRIQDFC
jgi:predicted RNA-binding protein with RPS1 domain